MALKKFEKKFGQSPVFVLSTFHEEGGGVASASPGSTLKEAIHVISCGYEDKTEWGKEVRLTSMTRELQNMHYSLNSITAEFL